MKSHAPSGNRDIQRRHRRIEISTNRPIKIALIVLLILLLIGAIPRIARMIQLSFIHHQLTSHVRSNEGVGVKAAPGSATLTLPGDIQARQQFPILARADGYLLKRLVDIGDTVKKDQLLAVISAPDLDEQLLQANADLRTQMANLHNAQANYVHYIAAWHASQAMVQQSIPNVDFDKVEMKRYNMLAEEGVVSREVRDSFYRQMRSDQALLTTNQENATAAKLQADAAQEQVQAAEQTVESYTHNQKRLAALQGYENVRAPCDGIITARYIDPGGLIQSGGNGTPILAEGQLDVLRVFVQVPQSAFRGIQRGNQVAVTVPEFPKRSFPGVVTNVSGGLDTQSRTLQVEVHVDNKDHVLPVGIYGEVKFNIPNSVQTVSIPVNAISARADGNFIAVVVNEHVHFKLIEIYRDHGASVEVSQGARPGDVILLDPPDDMQENESVHVIPTKINASPNQD